MHRQTIRDIIRLVKAVLIVALCVAVVGLIFWLFVKFPAILFGGAIIFILAMCVTLVYAYLEAHESKT